MGQGRSLKEILDAKISLHADAQVSWNKALAILFITACLLITIGLLYGNTFLGPSKNSYYDYHIGELKEILREQPGDRSTALELAMAIYLKGDARKGIALARQIHEKYPDDPDALFNLGLMLSDTAEYRESVSLLEKLGNRNPSFEPGKVAYYLGRGYFEIQEYEKAQASLNKAVQVDRGSPAAYYYLGLANEKLGDVKKALEAYRHSLLLTGEYPEAEKALERLSK